MRDLNKFKGCLLGDAVGDALGYAVEFLTAASIFKKYGENGITEYGDTILKATKDAMCMMPTTFPNAKHMDELLTLIQKAIALSEENIDDLDAIRQLGEGWVAEETLAIAVYCALKYSNDFEKGVIAAVNHDGDSDSTGAVAGNILGAALGIDAIPQKYLDNLELKDVVHEIAKDLHHDCQISEHGPWDNLWENKYIRMSYREKA